MLNNIEFDLWADGYDKTVGISDEENTYPFAGYKKVLGFIFQAIMRAENAAVLDIGFGTGTLTTKLYERGCSIYGQDFSSRMIALASEKMPNAHLYQGDFSKGLVEPLRNFRYDYIVATYSLHHLTDAQKNDFLLDLRNYLKESGKIIIGDVAFETRKASRPPVAHLSSASADFCRFYNFKAIKIPENSRFPGFSYICSICSVFGKSDGI